MQREQLGLPFLSTVFLRLYVLHTLLIEEYEATSTDGNYNCCRRKSGSEAWYINTECGDVAVVLYISVEICGISTII